MKRSIFAFIATLTLSMTVFAAPVKKSILEKESKTSKENVSKEAKKWNCTIKVTSYVNDGSGNVYIRVSTYHVKNVDSCHQAALALGW